MTNPASSDRQDTDKNRQHSSNFVTRRKMLTGTAALTAFALAGTASGQEPQPSASELSKTSTNQSEMKITRGRMTGKQALLEQLIAAVNQSIRKLEKQLALAKAQNHQEEIQKIQKKLHYKANKIQSLQAKIQKFKRQRESGIFRVTFGSSRLFDKQNRLEINGYANHEAWREDWRNARSNRIYYEGAKLFQSGNQLCKLIPNEQALIITVPPCLVNKYGQTIALHNVSFTYGKEWLENALIPTQYPDGKPRAGKQYYRTGTKQPVTYELVKRHGIWYVNAIIDQPISAITTSTENGVLGIDFNPSSLDWSIVDRHGNLKRHGSVKVNIQDKSTHQTQDILGKAIAQIVRSAALYQQGKLI